MAEQEKIRELRNIQQNYVRGSEEHTDIQHKIHKLSGNVDEAEPGDKGSSDEASINKPAVDKNKEIAKLKGIPEPGTEDDKKEDKPEEKTSEPQKNEVETKEVKPTAAKKTVKVKSEEGK